MNEKRIEKIIKDIVGSHNYKEGLEYDKDDITLVKRSIDDSSIYYYFSLDSGYYYRDVNVVLSNNFDGKIGYRCNCTEFYYHQRCKHIAACLNYYGNMVLSNDRNSIIKDISKNIFSTLRKENSYGYLPKEELQLAVEVDFSGKVTLKLGLNKLYVLKNKMLDFVKAYITKEDEVSFGKNFVYNPKCHYFNDVDKRIIDLFVDHYYSIGGYVSSSMILDLHDNSFKHLLELIRDKGFMVKDVGYIDNIIEEFPLSSTISKSFENYFLDIDFDSEVSSLTDDFTYIIYQDKCYHLKDSDAKFLKEIYDNNIQKLIFTDSELELFSQSVLPTVKDKIVVDKSADNIVIAKKPDTKLYFDMNYNDIVCNVKLSYGTNEIDYFDKDTKVLRDIDYEGSLLNDIFEVGFINKNSKFILDDLEDIGYFLEEGIRKLSDKYETFTSSKLKKINIIKNTNVKSNFSLGRDNIMRFDFDLGDINTSELDNIFDSLRKRKKYYKLKSGDIINLSNNNELKELEELASILDLSNSDIANASGEIPKYRALYLDSLKNSKYDIISTNSIFDEFIENFKNYKDINIKFNKSENEIIRDYQKTGIRWLYNIHKCSFGGILADEMGLGKSLQTLFFIKKLVKEDKQSKFLLVVPTSLVYNWENEILKFTPDISYQVFAGPKDIRRSLFEKNPTIYVTSYGLLREDFDYYENINFKVCIIDEAQNIKNPNAVMTKKVKQIKAETRIALTGTPLENSITELWSIFDFIMPGFLSSLVNFERRYNVKEFTEETDKRLSILNKQISPFILRRRKKDVLSELPDKIENNIFIDLTDSQKKLYAKEVEKVNKEIEKIVSEEGWPKARFLFLGLIMRLRQLCIDPSIIYDNYTEESSKMENLIKVVKDYVVNGHKILIFTSFKTALNIAKNKLSNEGISSYVIDGSVSAKKRMELVDKFNNDDTNVFLIMLKAGGTGLNLTSADVVIHLDIWWNPQAENQATDRAHRIGQKHNVEVIKLISEGTIEQRILELQDKKRLLTDKLIEGENRDKNVLQKLSDDELKYLISYGQQDSED